MDNARMLLLWVIAGAIGIPAGAVAQSSMAPVQRTTNFAGQSNWSGASSPAPPATSSYDRYAQPITPIGSSVSDRAQNVFNDTGSALREGVEAGIRAAEQGIQKVSGQVSNPFAAPAATSPSTSSTRGGLSPPWANTPANSGSATTGSISDSPAPSWPATPGFGNSSSNAAGSTITPINGGWTSIGTSVAAPKLLIPGSSTTSNYSGSTVIASRPGPSFPSAATNDPQPLHSVLKDPERPSSTASNSQPVPPADDWISNWGKESQTSSNAGATIGRNGNRNNVGIGNSPQAGIGRDPGLAQVQPQGSTPAAPASISNNDRMGDSWSGTDSWSQPSQPTLGSPSAPTGNSRQPAIASSGSAQSSPFGPSVPSSNQIAGQPAPQQPNQPTLGQALPGAALFSANQPPASGSQTGLKPIGTGTNPVGFDQNIAQANEPQPWMPLVAAVLVLAGSLAANLYLGASYLDARQKYQSLVRKTADTFRRVKAAAA